MKKFLRGYLFPALLFAGVARTDIIYANAANAGNPVV